MNRIEAYNGILKANGKTVYKGTKVKIQYKPTNILRVRYIGYNEQTKLFEFERDSKYAGKRTIMKIPTVQVNHRELYAIW